MLEHLLQNIIAAERLRRYLEYCDTDLCAHCVADSIKPEHLRGR